MCQIITFLTDKEFLQNFLSTLIGSGTALLVFYLTIRNEKKKSTELKEQETENRMRNFDNLVSSSISHAEGTIQNLNEIITLYNSNNLDFQLLRFAPNKSFERLDELLKNEDYFQSFVQKYGYSKVDTFNKISLEIDYFNMQINELWKMFEKAQNFDYERKVKFKNMSSNILNLLAKLTIRTDTGIPAEDLEKLNTHLYNFHQLSEENKTLKDLYDFNRLILNDVLIKHYKNLNITDILEEIRESSILFDEIIKQLNHHKENLISIKNEMNNALTSYILDTEK